MAANFLRKDTSRLYCILAALLILAVAALHIYHFIDRNYRQDEVNTVHAAQILSASETAQWMAINGVHPAGWRVLTTTWVKLVGISEPATRYSSTLFTMLALAFLFRLSADLFGWRTGLYAVFVLGTLPFALFFMQELRPYAMLVMVTAGVQWSFVRWLRKPNFTYALLFVMFGVAALQTHYYAGYVIAAQAVALVALVRWDRARYVRAFGLFAAVGLSLTAWALPLINRWVVGTNGKSYARPSTWNTLETLQHEMQIRPEALGQFLLLAGLSIPVGYTWLFWRSREHDRVFRFDPEWRKLYLVIVVVSILLIAFAVNTKIETITPRNLIVILPSLVIIVAFVMGKLPWQARAVLVVLITIPAVTEFHVYHPTSEPYRESAAYLSSSGYQPGDRIVTNVRRDQHLAFSLEDRLSANKYDMFHIGGEGINFPGDPHVNRVVNADPETLARFEAFLGNSERVWFFHADNALVPVAPFLKILNARYAVFRTATFKADVSYDLVEYRRVPDGMRDLFVFGDAIRLQSWQLMGSVEVKACEEISVESWWFTPVSLDGYYRIRLALANTDGMGVTVSDTLPTGYPTDHWQAGSYHVSAQTLQIPCDIQPGSYVLLLGMVDMASADLLPVAYPDGTPNNSNLVYLTTLTASP
jgi:hypothetical protein